MTRAKSFLFWWPLLLFWALLVALPVGPKTASGQNLPQNTASTDFATQKPAPPLGFERLTQKRTAGACVVAKGGTGTGTVFDSIKATQPTYPGSVIPKSFEMTLPNGQKVWVSGNATEHMAEFAQMKAVNYTPEAVRLSSQTQLTSLQGAVNTATQNGVPYNQLINVGGWELKFAPPRQPGQLPALIHAVPGQ
jgi:hypothetical protein